MNGRVEVFRGTGRVLPGYFYRLIAANGQTLSVSESYTVAWSARRAARKIAESLHVPVHDLSRPGAKPYRRYP